jgi:hypothetical protein
MELLRVAQTLVAVLVEQTELEIVAPETRVAPVPGAQA